MDPNKDKRSCVVCPSFADKGRQPLVAMDRASAQYGFSETLLPVYIAGWWTYPVISCISRVTVLTRCERSCLLEGV